MLTQAGPPGPPGARSTPLWAGWLLAPPGAGGWLAHGQFETWMMTLELDPHPSTPRGPKAVCFFWWLGVSPVWVVRLTVRLALKIPGFSAADHVESPTNPGRRRSVYRPTQPHQSMSRPFLFLLLEEPVEEKEFGFRAHF